MNTRSKSKSNNIINAIGANNNTALYEVNIDFDEASNAWNKNKKLIGNGHYKYICLHEKQCGTICKKICFKESKYCWSHRNTATK